MGDVAQFGGGSYYYYNYGYVYLSAAAFGSGNTVEAFNDYLDGGRVLVGDVMQFDGYCGDSGYNYL